MERLLGSNFWKGVVALYLGVVAAFGETVMQWVRHLVEWTNPYLPSLLQTKEVPPLTVLAPAVFSLIIAFFFLKPVWRWLWRLPVLDLSDRVFPDLNGRWQVELNSNWPIVEAVKNAAANKKLPPFDVANSKMPELQRVDGAIATIDQGWLGVKMTVEPTSPDSKIQRSTTISFDLIRRSGSRPHQIAYVFRQQNRPENRANLDEDEFIGAAMLAVSEDHKTLSGHYFTERNWIQARNTAGTITLRKIANK